MSRYLRNPDGPVQQVIRHQSQDATAFSVLSKVKVQV